MDRAPSEPFEATYASGTTGLVGTVEVAVLDGDGTVVIGPTTADITEQEVGGTPIGVYVWNAAAAPGDLGQYFIVWSPDGTWDPNTTSTPDELNIVSSSSGGAVIPPPADGGASVGPGTAWTTSDDAADCCELSDTTDTSVLDPYVVSASQLLFLLSGRLYYGLGAVEGARPLCRPGCGCGIQVLSRGHVVVSPRSWDWWGAYEGPCDPSRVLLSGYPIREVTQVKIDGVVIDSGEYRLERKRWLVRKNGEAWPSCQDMSIDDTEEGTWSVSYTFGMNPPEAGAQAANELACQMYRSCTGSDDCAIPQGAVRLTRQGVTIERGILARDPKTGAWSTGMPAVDHFLNAVNPRGRVRRPIVQSPASRLRYARKVA